MNFPASPIAMPLSWMIKLTDCWAEPKNDSEGEDDGYKIEKGRGRRKQSLSVPLFSSLPAPPPVVHFLQNVDRPRSKTNVRKPPPTQKKTKTPVLQSIVEQNNPLGSLLVSEVGGEFLRNN